MLPLYLNCTVGRYPLFNHFHHIKLLYSRIYLTYNTYQANWVCKLQPSKLLNVVRCSTAGQPKPQSLDLSSYLPHGVSVPIEPPKSKSCRIQWHCSLSLACIPTPAPADASYPESLYEPIGDGIDVPVGPLCTQVALDVHGAGAYECQRQPHKGEPKIQEPLNH